MACAAKQEEAFITYTYTRAYRFWSLILIATPESCTRGQLFPLPHSLHHWQPWRPTRGLFAEGLDGSTQPGPFDILYGSTLCWYIINSLALACIHVFTHSTPHLFGTNNTYYCAHVNSEAWRIIHF